MGPDAVILVFWMLCFKPTISSMIWLFWSHDVLAQRNSGLQWIHGVLKSLWFLSLSSLFSLHGGEEDNGLPPVLKSQFIPHGLPMLLLFLDQAGLEQLRISKETHQAEAKGNGRVPGASVRNSACGKGHEEGGSTYAKAGSSLRSPPRFSSIYPQNQSLPTLLLCALTYTSDFTGGCPPPPLSEKELTYSSS